MKQNDIDYIKSYIKTNVNRILLFSDFADDTIDPYKKIAEILTFPEDVERVRMCIKDKFNFEIHQDISKMTPAQLYTMLFFVVYHSDARKAKILKGKKQNTDTPLSVSDATANLYNGKLWNRRFIFGYIIGSLRSAFGRSIQSTERISDIVKEAYDTGVEPTAFLQKLKELESFFGIKIDQEMKIFNIGDAAEKSLIAQGKAVNSEEDKESMNPLWATIHAALSINFWRSVIIRELGVRISSYTLSRVRSYEEFEALVNDARQKRSKTVAPKKYLINHTKQKAQKLIQETIMKRLFASQGEVVPTAKLIDLGANSLDILDICTDIEKLFNVRLDSNDFQNIGTIDDVTVGCFTKILEKKYGFKPDTDATLKAYDQTKSDLLHLQGDSKGM